MRINQDLTLANVTKRLKAPTPVFFKKLRTVGLILGAVGAAILASPVALPAIVVTAGGYLFTAGSCIAAVCQTTTTDESKN